MGIDAEKVLTYRQRAQHLRVVADGILNAESRELMLSLAEDCERLADTIEAVIGVLPPELKSQNFKLEITPE
jgi:hypothetical protein